MPKKVILGPKPQPQPSQTSAEEWVNKGQRIDNFSSHDTDQIPSLASNPNRGSKEVATKRLTVDIPESMHAKIKSFCALKGVKMTDEIRAVLEAHFGDQDIP